MQKLLCIISTLNVGGAETFLVKLFRKLDKQKYSFDFCINTFQKCFYDDEIVSMGGKIHRIHCRKNHFIKHTRELRSIIKKEKYDRILVVSSNATSFYDLKIAKKAGAVLCAARSSNSNPKSNILNKFVHYLFRFFLIKYVDVMISPSDLAANHMFGKKNASNGRVVYLHNGLDVDLFKFNIQYRENIRIKYGLLNDDIVIGCVGRFSKQKNHRFLIEIFNKLYAENSKYKLMLVGTGELIDEVQKQIVDYGLEKAVIFIDVTASVYELYSAMDCFLLTSFFEGMPNVVIEAQASGLPCFISDSITKESNIIGNVKYLPTNSNVDVWCKEIKQADFSSNRMVGHIFKAKKYDIDSCVAMFENIIFRN